MKHVLEELYENNAKKLYLMVDKILHSIGCSYYNDKDEFYAEASEVLADIVVNHRYDEKKGNFEGYLYGALRNAVLDILKKRNTYKRRANKMSLSLDTPISSEGNLTIGDLINSDFDIIKELEERNGVLWEENIEEYLKSLTKIQRNILNLKIEGATIEEIKSQLNITNKQYEQNIKAMRCFEHISKLQDHIKIQLSSKKEDEEDMSISTQTLEKSKPDRMSIHSIVKKMDKRTIRFDHPLQRSSDQWSPVMKGNLISDILQGNPLPELVFAEQVINGIAIIWDLDGKQRCTNAYSFIKDQYRISRNIRRWIIEYQAQVVDENEQVAVDENNFPVYERKECDIRGKKFSDLPEELQEKFQDYNFEITQYLNCNADDIAYHIARYNEGKPATVSQKGIIRLGEEYAATVKSISNMSFFKDMGGYKVSEFKNGVINRVVVESVMAAYYLSNWKKKQEDMCDYIKANAKMVDFENFEELVQRLEKVVTNEVANMFDSKDSFLWFGLFARFAQMKEKDELFIDFMMEFMESLHSKQINNISFDDLNGKSTKDKVVVQRKMMHLETLLQDFIASQEKKEVEFL
jgi:RNA polymerase sigma factor (sigma-70 family)